MATQLNLHDTQTNGIGATYFDMDTVLSDAVDIATAVTNTTASGTEIQTTQTAGGTLIVWVSGRVPAGGFTLTTADVIINAAESNMAANVGGRARIFKRDSGGTETELTGGPFDDGAEWGTGGGAFAWTCNVTDTAFAENDRILLKLYLTNVGTMAGGHTGTVNYDYNTIGIAATEFSYLNIAETVTFKPEKFSLPIFGTRPRIIKRRF